jgi:ferrochelatase
MGTLIFCVFFFLQAMADIVAEHLQSDEPCSRQMTLRCPMFMNAVCGPAKEFFANQKPA